MKKIFTILFALVAGFGFSWAATVTVTWNNNDITGSGSSFTKDGVTITVDYIDFGDKNFRGGGTFTTTLGNFTKIEVTAARCNLSGTGWIRSTWTGNASSVSFSGDIKGMGLGNTKFVFTIEQPTVNVTGVTLSQSEAAMTVGGEAVTLTATVAPDNATDKTVVWTSSDPTVATVADGVVTAVAAGSATITATATNGTDDTADDKTATCTITVTDPDQEAADAVLALFDALPAVENITLDSKAAIEAARAAYNALTDEQKALIAPEDLAKLTIAEEALAAAVKAAADQKAAEAVEALFDALPAADAVTRDSKAAIEAARAAYNALTDEQKALIAPEDLAKLTIAEEALAALIKEGVENVQGEEKNVKIIENGQLLILRGDKTFTVTGQEVK